jgi:hypothetical protein
MGLVTVLPPVYCPTWVKQCARRSGFRTDGGGIMLPARTTRFVIRVGLPDDGASNLADRLDAVVRQAITEGFGIREPDLLVTIGLDPPNRFGVGTRVR